MPSSSVHPTHGCIVRGARKSGPSVDGLDDGLSVWAVVGTDDDLGGEGEMRVEERLEVGFLGCEREVQRERERRRRRRWGESQASFDVSVPLPEDELLSRQKGYRERDICACMHACTLTYSSILKDDHSVHVVDPLDLESSSIASTRSGSIPLRKGSDEISSLEFGREVGERENSSYRGRAVRERRRKGKEGGGGVSLSRFEDGSSGDEIESREERYIRLELRTYS